MYRQGNTIYGVVQEHTGSIVSYNKEENLQDSDCDGVVIRKLGFEYFRLNSESITPEMFGAVGDGEHDDTQAIQRALDFGGKVILSNKKYVVSNYLLISESYTSIIGNGAELLASGNITSSYNNWGNSHRYQMIVVDADFVYIDNITTNGNDYKAGGISSNNHLGIRVSRCKFKNSIDSQGITLTACTDVKIDKNEFYRLYHGVQLWMCRNVTVNDNKVNLISQGGIWNALSYQIRYFNNDVKNCGDVGIDMEGGTDIIVSNNIISSCNNGEISIFRDAITPNSSMKNYDISNNIVNRYDTYTDTSNNQVPTSNIGGGIYIASISTTDNENIRFANNIITSINRFGIYQNAVDSYSKNLGLTFEQNTIKTNGQSFMRFLGGKGLSILRNRFISDESNNTYQNELKNISGAIISENKFFYKNKTSGFAMFYFTDMTGIDQPVFSDNEVYGANGLEFKHDPYVSGTRAILTGNKFKSITSTPNGTPIVVGPRNDASNNTLFETGGIGIGTNTPTEKLDVAGYIKSNGVNIPEVTNGRTGRGSLINGVLTKTVSTATTQSIPEITCISVSGAWTLTIRVVAVCTANTLTITAYKSDGTINTGDTSTYTYNVKN